MNIVWKTENLVVAVNLLEYLLEGGFPAESGGGHLGWVAGVFLEIAAGSVGATLALIVEQRKHPDFVFAAGVAPDVCLAFEPVRGDHDVAEVVDEPFLHEGVFRGGALERGARVDLDEPALQAGVD